MLCQKRTELRMNLIEKIRGSKRINENWCEDEREVRDDYERREKVLDDGEQITEASSRIEESADNWITEEDKHLLRYYYYILHEVDDVHAGTLDSATLKKIRSMVSAKWQKRYNKCSMLLIQEIERDYINSMKKSIVDFVLQEPFEEAYDLYALVSVVYMIRNESY